MNELWLPLKEKFFDLPEYREFVVLHGCVVHNDKCAGDIHPHHTVFQSEGVKSSDLDCIGLCALHHREIHNSTREAFAAKYHLSYEWLTRKYIHSFLYHIMRGHEIVTARKPKERARGKAVLPLGKQCNPKFE